MNTNKKLKVLISGASGLIGSALKGVLEKEGHEIWSLTRHEPGERRIAWDPRAGILEPGRLEGFDAVVHLAGETIASRWTAARKREIRESRVRGTLILAEALAALSRKPEVFLCVSAIGYYGNRGDEVLEENSAPGQGYLPEVCRDWEEAAAPAQRAGIRIVNLRTGIVLTPKGGRGAGPNALALQTGYGRTHGFGKPMDELDILDR